LSTFARIASRGNGGLGALRARGGAVGAGGGAGRVGSTAATCGGGGLASTVATEGTETCGAAGGGEDGVVYCGPGEAAVARAGSPPEGGPPFDAIAAGGRVSDGAADLAGLAAVLAAAAVCVGAT
jgi:hypothetical protein